MNNLVTAINNQVVVSSKGIAERFEKRHVEVLDKIREILSVEKSTNEFFHETSYSYNGRILPMYLMNRDGFSLLAMGFTGKKALQWKIKYIEAFNQMEEELKRGKKEKAPKRLMWEGQIVIRPIELAEMIGVDVSRVRSAARKFGLRQFFLIGDEMRRFRRENHLPPSPSPRVLVYPEKTVRALIQILKRASTALVKINEYFLPAKVATPTVTKEPAEETIISIASPKVLNQLEKLRKQVVLLEGMITHFPTYKRTRERHVHATELMSEVSTTIISDLHQLSKDIAVAALPEV